MRNAIVLMGVLLLLVASAWAADKIQPFDVRLGAWESMTVSEMSGIEIPPEALAQMTPEQRVQAQAALKAQMSQGPSKKTRQSCVTKESMDKLFDIQDKNSKSNCQRTGTVSTSRKLKFTEVCMEAGGQSSSDVQFEATDSTHVKGSVRGLVTRKGAGHPMHMNLTFNARWLGSDCSALKNSH